MAEEPENSGNPTTYGTMLATIRLRRWFLWSLILIYIPGSVTALLLGVSDRWLGIFFMSWLVLLCVAVTLMACSKCPRCGNNFHMGNAALSFSRKCCHCGLHILEIKNDPLG